jgi:hypothetical protein
MHELYFAAERSEIEDPNVEKFNTDISRENLPKARSDKLLPKAK